MWRKLFPKRDLGIFFHKKKKKKNIANERTFHILAPCWQNLAPNQNKKTI
jgi:hypothetical protein